MAAAHAVSLPDRDLLDRFAKDRDEASFAALVERHGGMVLAVCRRVLGHVQDAEDACQAAFLVLARRAGSVRKKESLPSWLHRVAYHIAADLRRQIARRRGREVPQADALAADGADDITWRELRSLLDEELQRLPERYRSPLVLCCLQGKTRDEAALELGWNLQTLKGRLERGRERLRRRLVRRGVTLSAAWFSAGIGQSSAPAAVSARLAVSTAKAAALLRAGQAAPGLISAQVVALMKGALHMLWIAKLKSVATIALATFLLLGGGTAIYQTWAQTSGDQKAPPLAAILPPSPRQASLDNAGDEKQNQEDEALRAREDAARADEAKQKAARDAAIKAAKDKETPTAPAQPKAADLKVDFVDLTVNIVPFAPFAVKRPEIIRIRGDAVCEYRIEERPARGDEPKWDAAYLDHRLPMERLTRLEGLLKKTNWLTAPGHDGLAPPAGHPTTYLIKLKRKGEERAVRIAGQRPEPYKSLVDFFEGIALQEYLVYRLERVPGKERFNACREIDQYIQAEHSTRYAKPIYEIDLHRYIPTFQRHVRYPFNHQKEEIVPGIRLLGHFKLESEREAIADLANDRDYDVRVVVAEALGRLGGKESLLVLRRMVRSTNEAAWELIRQGPIAVPTIVEMIESGNNPMDERQPGFLDYQKLIRAYIDHWSEVTQPVDERVLAAVRKSMALPKVKAYGTQYHKQLLDLASR